MQRTLKQLVKHRFQTPRKVICLGLGKTGTTTFGECMKILGFKHSTAGVGFDFENRNTKRIRRYANRFDSFDDFPWPYMYREFDKWFPRSRFILLRRKNVDSWYRSLEKHYLRNGSTDANYLFYGFRNPTLVPNRMKDLYADHLENVRSYFQGDPRFLELCWEEGDGWEILCNFLDVSVPHVPFPHANKAPVASMSKP